MSWNCGWEKFSTRFNTEKSSIGRFIYTDTLYRRFDQIAANVSSLTHAISTGQGTIGKLIVSRTMYDKLNHTLDSLNATLDAVRSGHGTAAKLINDPSLYNHLNRLAKNLNSTVTAINQGKGTAGTVGRKPPAGGAAAEHGGQSECHSGRGAGGQRLGRPAL